VNRLRRLRVHHTPNLPAQPQTPAARPAFRAAALLRLLGAGLALILAGCSARRFEQAADRQTYRLIQQYEQHVFGRTNEFTIATAYTGRDPDTVRPEEILADRTATNRRLIDLEEALGLAVAHSREYQTQKEQLYLTALTLTGAQHEFSPQFFADTEGRIQGSPDGPAIGTLNSQVGVSQLLRTGGRLSVALANDLLRFFTRLPPGQSRDSAVSLISVNLSQPLLRGFGRNDPRVEALTQAERNVVYAVRSFSQYQREFAVDVVNAYFTLLRQKDTVRNNYTNYVRRVESTQYLEARSVDRASRSQVDDARSAELSARIAYVNSVAAYLTGVADFKLRLGLPQTEEVFIRDADLRDLADAGLLPAEISRNAGFALAVEGHMDILNAIDRFEDTQRRVRLAADALKPGLLLTSSLTLESEPPHDYAEFDLDELRYSAGLALDLPLDRLRERNTYRAALVSFESQIRSLGQTLDGFRSLIEEGLRSLEQERLNYLSRQDALEVANRRVENNTLLFEAGRATIRDLREAQDNLVQAQNDLTFSLVNYLRVRLDLLLNLGVLRTEEPQFWLRDPLAGRLTEDMRGPSPLQMPRGELIPPDQFLEPRP